MSELSRRKFLELAGVAGLGLTAVTLSSCSAVTGGGAAAGASDGVLTIGAATGAGNTFPHNFNVFGGGTSAPGTGLFFETLFRISQEDGGKLLPNLAESVEFTRGGRTATYKLRKGVTWNDGKPFTADDVVFTYNFVFGPAGPPDPSNPSNTPFLFKPVSKIDDYTVLVQYNDPNFQEDTNLSEYYPIYPAHIYSKVGNRQKYVDTNPVGTGPGKLKSFGNERIEVAIRDDYWGGKTQGVKSVVIVPQGTVGNIQSQISHGKVDWSDGGGQGVLTTFLGMSKQNKYTYWPDGSNRGLLFLCTSAPTDDKYVRRALRAAIDYEAAQKAVGTGFPIPTVPGLDMGLYGNLIIPSQRKAAHQDIPAAKKALADGGWSVVGGNLTKGGKAYPLDIAVDLAQPDDIVVVPMLVSMWKSALGINVEQKSLADAVFQKEMPEQKFHISFWTTNLNGSAFNAYESYSWANLGEKQQAAGYGNQGRWKAPAAVNDALGVLQSTPSTDVAAIQKQLSIIQEAVVDEAPFVAMIPGGGGEMYSVQNWTGWPVPGQSTFAPRTGGYNLINQVVISLAPAKS